MPEGKETLIDAPVHARRHGLVARVGGHCTERWSDDGALKGAIRSSLDTAALNRTGMALASTGDIAPLPNGGAVAIAGSPRFTDEALAALARVDGNASALAAGYTAHGEDVFGQLAGAFCCCIVDSEQDKVLAAVDRVGRHALHYLADSSGISLGSEAGSALSDPAGRTLLAQGVYHYVYFHMVPAPGTVINGLRKLPAAHYLVYRGGQCETACYWQPGFDDSATADQRGSLQQSLRDALRVAVRNSLPAQGRVGAFLSGGLDSSTVVGVMSELAEKDAQAYAIGFSAEGYDEMAFARTTAQHFGVTLNEYYVTPEDVVDALPKVATSYDEPFGNSSALPAYFCALMAAKHGVTTLLAGDGGDELFAGNERYARQEVFERYARVPRFLRTGLLEPVIRLMPSALPLVAKARSYIDQANTPLPDRLQSYNFLHRHAADEMFEPSFLAHVDTSEPLRVQRAVFQRPEDASDLNRMLYLDWQITLADNDLRKVGHMCALAGVDVAYPMLDDGLLELSSRVPTKWKISNGDLRHFFKEALRGWLPDATINKSKQGFGLPFGVWMKTHAPLRELAYDNLAMLKARRIVRPDFIDRVIEMHQRQHAAYYGELVWILTVLELWLSANGEASAGWID